MAVSSAELMTKFCKLVSSSVDDLLNNVVHASSFLEGKDRGSLKGVVIIVRKAKSLVGGWLEKPSGIASPSSPSPVDNRIERDTIISANVIVGRGGVKCHRRRKLSRCGCPRKILQQVIHV